MTSLLIIFYFQLFSQTKDLCRPEIWTQIDNVPYSLIPVTFTFSPYVGGSIFCKDLSYNNWFTCELSDLYPSTTNSQNGVYNFTRGITICYEDLEDACQEDNYGFSIYKVSCSATDKYFYINILDNNYTGFGYLFDLIILFDYSYGGRYFWKKANSEDWTLINNKQVLSIWEMFGYSPPTTLYFPNFWQNCLYIDEYADNPILIWGKYPTSEFGAISKYRIYRKLPGGSEMWIGTTSTPSYSFIDHSIDLDISQPLIEYRIKGLNSSSQETSFSGSGYYCGTLNWSNAIDFVKC